MTLGQQRMFSVLLQQHGIPAPEYEHRFHPTRRWRLDCAWPEQKVALEVDGGIFTGGRHVQGAWLLKEHEKMNEAACMGWRILRCVPKELLTTATVEMVRRALSLLTISSTEM